MGFIKKEWVKENLICGLQTGQWTREHVMELAMKYSIAGVLNDSDLAELETATAELPADTVLNTDEISAL